MTIGANETSKQQSSEIDLLELWDVLESGKVLIVAITIAFAISSVVYAATRTEIYRAETLLAPAVNRESSSPLAGQLGGAAALVGINLGQTGDSQVISVLTTLQSREFILNFISANNLRDSLFPELVEGSEIPTDWQIYRKFHRVLAISRESDSGLVRLSIEWPDPAMAADWANQLVVAINAHEKQRDVEEAESAIEYLQSQLSTTQLVEMQRVFYQLIEAQTRVVMLADVRDEYVFRVIDPAVVPDQRVAPQRRAIVIVGTLIGAAIAVLLVIFKHLIFERRIFSRQFLADRGQL